jgi:hypothetical protein
MTFVDGIIPRTVHIVISYYCYLMFQNLGKDPEPFQQDFRTVTAEQPETIGQSKLGILTEGKRIITVDLLVLASLDLLLFILKLFFL